MKDFLKRYQYIIYMIIVEIIIFILEPVVANYVFIFFALLILLLFGILAFLYKKKIIDSKQLKVYFVISLGFLIRCFYIIKVGYGAGHDVSGTAGHEEYIRIIYETGKLPTTNTWQFYHPPLWHLICAGILKINDLFSIPLERGLEGLQYVSLFFSSLIMIINYKIIDQIKIKENIKILMLIFLVFYSHHIYLAGSINNDTLLLFFQYLILYYLLVWYEKDNFENTILLALATGLAVMTKLNGAIMAIPIMFVFIKKFIDYIKKDKERIKMFIVKMLIFGLISLPIGLWYQVRNYIKFDQKIGYVPEPTMLLYTGDYNLYERFFSFSVGEFLEIGGYTWKDHNIPSFLVKSSIFGEYAINNINIIHKHQLYINLILIFLSVILCLKYYIHRKKDLLDWLLLITWLTNIVSFCFFNYKYPYGCTMDFRYILPKLFCSGVIFIKEANNLNNKALKTFINISIVCFCLLSVATILIVK